MEKWKEEYKQMPIPENLKEKMEESIMRAKNEKKREKKLGYWKKFGSMAAVLAVLLVLPNTSQTVSAAMQQIPLLGDFFKVVTIREFQVDEERHIADVKVPGIETEEIAEADGSEVAKQAEETVENINFDIQQVTDQLIAEFEKTMEEYKEEGYQDLMINSTVLTNDDKWFSLDLMMYQGAGSGFEQHRHYTIDKTTGKRAVLSDFYGEDYVEEISEQVKAQMKAQMEADENLYYWLDDPEMKDGNFKEIKSDQDFYVNAEGRVVVCFDEYEVAPGYMGSVEFVLE